MYVCMYYIYIYILYIYIYILIYIYIYIYNMYVKVSKIKQVNKQDCQIQLMAYRCF